ncbi:MAG: serine hydrolase domain-containing protein [Bacteroidota bacterium]
MSFLRSPFICFILFLVPPALLQSQPRAGLPDTPAGRHVTAYVSAFNAGETEMREFLKNHWAPDALQSVSLEARLARYNDMRRNLGSLAFHRLLDDTGNALVTIMRSERAGWLEVTFSFDDSPPRAVTRISIQPTDDPDQAFVRRSASVADMLTRVSAYMDSLTALDLFSGVVAIARNDSFLFHRAYGSRDRERRLPNHEETRFNVGSINKIFTRLAILHLASEGRLSLSDTVGRFLPAYPNGEVRHSVTIQHLITMSSGIGDFFGDRYEAADKEKILTLEDYLPLFADKPLEFPPGTGTRYSNGGYILLGLIVQRASGIDYFAYVRKHVFAPAGMTASDWFRKAALPSDAALGYSTENKISNYPTLPGRGSSAGGGYSTTGDLFRFVHALEDGILKLPDVQNGLGIAGGAPGLNAALEWDPRSGYVIIVLANLDPPAAGRVAQYIRRTLPVHTP